MVALLFQAGGKELLLKNLLGSKDEKKTVYQKSDDEKLGGVNEADRQRVIEAYRNLKRQRNNRLRNDNLTAWFKNGNI